VLAMTQCYLQAAAVNRRGERLAPDNWLLVGPHGLWVLPYS
jgi:hypothetical protein